MTARDDLSVWRAQAAELPTDVLRAELERRGYEVLPEGWQDTVIRMPPIRSYPIEVLTGEWPPMAGEGRAAEHKDVGE